MLRSYKWSAPLAFAMALMLLLQLAGTAAAAASLGPVIIPIGPDEATERFEAGYETLLGGELLPLDLHADLAQALDGHVFQPDRLTQLDSGEAWSLAQAVPWDEEALPSATGGTRFVASTNDQAMILDVALSGLAAAVTLHLVPTLDGAGVHQKAWIRSTATQAFDSVVLITQYAGSSVTAIHQRDSAVTCGGGCFLGGLAIGTIGVFMCAGVQAPITCGLAFLVGGSAATWICDVECVQRSRGAYDGKIVYCEAVGCGTRGALSVVDAVQYSSSNVLARFDWVGKVQWNAHTWSIESATHQNGMRLYSLIGYVGDNGSSPTVCGSVSVAVTAHVRLSNGHSQPAWFGSSKTPTPCG